MSRATCKKLSTTPAEASSITRLYLSCTSSRLLRLGLPLGVDGTTLDIHQTQGVRPRRLGQANAKKGANVWSNGPSSHRATARAQRAVATLETRKGCQAIKKWLSVAS